MKKCTDVTRSGNVLYLEFSDSETNETTEEMFIMKFDDTVIVHEELEWVYHDELKEGAYPMVILLDKESAYGWKKPEIYGLHKNAVKIFYGDSLEAVKKKIRPFIAKKKRPTGLKVIDFEIAGRQMKLYLGNMDCDDYWGDDWDDAPYEHNAGTVYDDFVKDTVVITFPGDDVVKEICEGTSNSPYCKRDFIEGTPFAYIPKDDDDNWHRSGQVISKKDIGFYFETPIEKLLKMCRKEKWVITEA